jgi:hypothetical protein
MLAPFRPVKSIKHYPQASNYIRQVRNLKWPENVCSRTLVHHARFAAMDGARNIQSAKGERAMVSLFLPSERQTPDRAARALMYSKRVWMPRL